MLFPAFQHFPDSETVFKEYQHQKALILNFESAHQHLDMSFFGHW